MNQLVIDDQVIQIRKEDGFVNLTQICKLAGKTVSNYKTNQSTQDYFRKLETKVF